MVQFRAVTKKNFGTVHRCEKPGFRPTGRIVNEGEAEMVLELNEGQDHR